jgi:TRAP-type C4-dicarboxylate transport system permease large subunit
MRPVALKPKFGPPVLLPIAAEIGVDAIHFAAIRHIKTQR